VKFVLTKHAQDVMEEREIPMAWVARVLDGPDRVEADRRDPELEHRLGRIPERQGRVLRVVLGRKARLRRIITVYFDRKMRGKL